MSSLEVCPACGVAFEGAEVMALRNPPVRYLCCSECGLLTMNPPPDAAQVASFYPTSSYGLGESKFPSLLEKLRDRSQQQRARWVHASLALKRASILDIGCGNGIFLKFMGGFGHAIYGTELPGPAAERARAVAGLQLTTENLSADTLPQHSFDAISLWHVLEHLQDPAQVLSCCRDLLSPDGQLFLEVPNLSSWQGTMFGKYWLHLDPPRHLHQFTERSLDCVLARAGFKVEERAHFSLSMGWMGMLQSSLNCLMEPRDLFYNLLLTRGNYPASRLKKCATLAEASLGAPLAFLAALIEGAAGSGAVLRYRCRVSTVSSGEPR